MSQSVSIRELGRGALDRRRRQNCGAVGGGGQNLGSSTERKSNLQPALIIEKVDRFCKVLWPKLGLVSFACEAIRGAVMILGLESELAQ